MKNISIILFLVFAMLSGCKKENDRAFDQTPEQRLTASLKKYQDLLEGASNGWKAVVQTDSGRGLSYGFYFKFDNRNRVTMYSDFEPGSASTPKESSYRLKALQQVSLLFDTYSYIHVLADPDPRVAGGEVGNGYGVDFEFFFDGGNSRDTINMIGIKNGSKARFIRATKEEADAYNSGNLSNSIKFPELYNSIFTYWKSVTINGVNYQVIVSSDSRSVVINWIGSNGQPQTFTSSFYYTSLGIEFYDALINGTVVIKGFSNFSLNAADGSINVIANNTTTSLKGIANPIYVDINAAKRWWDFSVAEDDFWFSSNGFHVNGIDDAFGIGNLPGFSGLFYGANYVTLPTGQGDALLFSGQYGPIMSSPPEFTVNGRIIIKNSGFRYVEPAGTPTNPINNTRNKMNDPVGYYLVQTGPNSYDMVVASPSNATSWITWIF